MADYTQKMLSILGRPEVTGSAMTSFAKARSWAFHIANLICQSRMSYPEYAAGIDGLNEFLREDNGNVRASTNMLFGDVSFVPRAATREEYDALVAQGGCAELPLPEQGPLSTLGYNVTQGLSGATGISPTAVTLGALALVGVGLGIYLGKRKGRRRSS